MIRPEELFRNIAKQKDKKMEKKSVSDFVRIKGMPCASCGCFTVNLVGNNLVCATCHKVH